MKRLVTAVAVAGFLLAGCGAGSSPSAPPTKPKTTHVASGPTYFLGNRPANLKGEKYVPANGSTVCSAALCYGGGVNSGGATDVPAIAVVTTQGGVISGYTENFAYNTPLLTAEEQILSGFPPDTLGFGNRTPTESGGCGDIRVTSPAIAKLSALDDPSGTITIALSYINSNLVNVYDPSNIQQAEIVAGKTPTC